MLPAVAVGFAVIGIVEGVVEIVVEFDLGERRSSACSTIDDHPESIAKLLWYYYSSDWFAFVFVAVATAGETVVVVVVVVAVPSQPPLSRCYPTDACWAYASSRRV